jgi:hypothetical protein
MASNIRVDLAEVRTSAESRVFSGRDRGEAARRKFGLPKLDTSDDIVTVVIPTDTYSINTSFFLGMFGDSIRKLGRAPFLEKYRFECGDVHRASIREGVDRALKENSILGGSSLRLAAMV